MTATAQYVQAHAHTHKHTHSSKFIQYKNIYHHTFSMYVTILEHILHLGLVSCIKTKFSRLAKTTDTVCIFKINTNSGRTNI